MLHKVEKQMFDGRRVATSFRRGLESYEKNAVVQREIATQLADGLKMASQTNQFERALEFGCGTGYLTRSLMKRFQLHTHYLNDVVSECEAKTNEIAPEATFIDGPIQDVQLPERLDLVASSSAIQWIPGLKALIEHATSKLENGGWLALSGFGPDHFSELQDLGSRAAAPSYADCEELAAMLPKDMHVALLKTSQIQLEFDGLAPLLRHLRDTGVNGRADGALSKANFHTFEQRYTQKFGIEGKLPLTYQPVWLIAQRKF